MVLDVDEFPSLLGLLRPRAFCIVSTICPCIDSNPIKFLRMKLGGRSLDEWRSSEFVFGNTYKHCCNNAISVCVNSISNDSTDNDVASVLSLLFL